MEGSAAKNAILTMRHGVVTRGVLYDIPRLKGVPYLEPGERVTVADLGAWEPQAGVAVGPGDAFLIRWGRWARQDAIGPFDTGARRRGSTTTSFDGFESGTWRSSDGRRRATCPSRRAICRASRCTTLP